MASQSVINFMKQQGFTEEIPSISGAHFAGLTFQPRIIGALVVLGILLQSRILFLMLSTILWWNALVPSLNPFEINVQPHDCLTSRATPAVAPGPRRFAQGMAATFVLIIGIGLMESWTITAYLFEWLIVVAISALLFGRFCLGSYIYHLLFGQLSFANATFPWARQKKFDK